MDDTGLEKRASLAFPIMQKENAALPFFPAENQKQEAGGSQTVHIENLYLQADDCKTLLDFVRVIMHSVHRPEEVPV
jgi:hypothetical protein